ncbi:DUF7878 domain-containing protein [Streptomyces cavourensis]
MQGPQRSETVARSGELAIATRSRPGRRAACGAAPDIDAELTVWDNDRAPWSEELLPVAELAYWLTHWLQSPRAGARDLALDSISADPG